MSGNTHIAGGVLAGSAVLLLAQQVTPELSTFNIGIPVGASYLFFSSISALLPDIDEKNSKIGRRLWFISWPIYILQRLCKLLTFFVPKRLVNVNYIIGHRGFSHFPITWVILTAFVSMYVYVIKGLSMDMSTYLFMISPAAGFSLGILSHLVLDFFSGRIIVFAPLSLKGYGIYLVRSGSLVDHLIGFTFFLLSCYLLRIYWFGMI